MFINSNVFLGYVQLAHIAAKPSVPIVPVSGAPRMCHSSYLEVNFTKELILGVFRMILESLGDQNFKYLTIIASKM